jgi:hypothetical protein
VEGRNQSLEKSKVAKPTPEELAEEGKRSTATGFFNFAETYWRAARTLKRSKKKASHKESPIRFLYYHAIELYLKAFLCAHGLHPYELRTKYGHGAHKLSDKTEELGLFLMDEDKEVLSMMAEPDTVIRSRYLMTGYFQWPDLGALDRTCKSLRLSIAKELKTKGHAARL